MGKKQEQQPPGPDRAGVAKILIPAAAVAGVIILIGVIAGIAGSKPQMSDGSDGSADDPGLKEVAAGVKYRDLKEGEGEPCPPGAKVMAKYRGWLPDGTEFDSSKGKAASFDLHEVVVGWQEGIPGMKPGGVRKLVIAPEKGYGQQARGAIPANSTLIFEVELVSFTPGPKPAPKTLSDGTAPGASDPNLKDIGDGLKIRDLKEGTGPEVKPGATVVAHYTGWLTDGKVFDSSIPRGEPTEFSLTRVVKGWQEGIPGMKVGGVRKLVIPPELAYGKRGAGNDVPPDATLVFQVEIVAVK